VQNTTSGADISTCVCPGQATNTVADRSDFPASRRLSPSEFGSAFRQNVRFYPIEMSFSFHRDAKPIAQLDAAARNLLSRKKSREGGPRRATTTIALFCVRVRAGFAKPIEQRLYHLFSIGLLAQPPRRRTKNLNAVLRKIGGTRVPDSCSRTSRGKARVPYKSVTTQELSYDEKLSWTG